jgi:hypothetical protein
MPTDMWCCPASLVSKWAPLHWLTSHLKSHLLLHLQHTQPPRSSAQQRLLPLTAQRPPACTSAQDRPSSTVVLARAPVHHELHPTVHSLVLPGVTTFTNLAPVGPAGPQLPPAQPAPAGAKKADSTAGKQNKQAGDQSLTGPAGGGSAQGSQQGSGGAAAGQSSSDTGGGGGGAAGVGSGPPPKAVAAEEVLVVGAALPGPGCLNCEALCCSSLYTNKKRVALYNNIQGLLWFDITRMHPTDCAYVTHMCG